MGEETVPVIPYIKLLKGRDPLEVLGGSPARLATLLDGLTPEEVERKPSPTKWNLREIMAHLADCEIVWSWRLRQIFSEDNAILQPFEQDTWARIYASYSMTDARATWNALRVWNLAFLSGLTDAQKDRSVTHPEIGRLTLWIVASVAAGHDLHHLHLIERAIQR